MTEAGPPKDAALEAAVKRDALALGFDGVRIARADEPWDADAHLRRFVELGRHGDMDWMATTQQRRARPTAMWPQARSAVVVASNYGPARNPLERLAHKELGLISVYAQGADYHDVMKKRLKRLARKFAEETGAEVKVFVDTAPLMEKPLAEKSGLGWRGKHTNLVSREFGSWLFLGVMLTAAELRADASETDHCGACRACLDICPTQAFPAPYELDARRCVSYLTIEHKGPIPAEFRDALGNRIYGCDDCLAVCPWNKFAQTAREHAFHPRIELSAPMLIDLARLDEASFRAFFAGSPVKRLGRARFLRNVALALGNCGDQSAMSAVERLLDDDEPVVRGAAVWAAGKLAPERFAELRAARFDGEADEDVRAEWRAFAGPDA